MTNPLEHSSLSRPNPNPSSAFWLAHQLLLVHFSQPTKQTIRALLLPARTLKTEFLFSQLMSVNSGLWIQYYVPYSIIQFNIHSYMFLHFCLYKFIYRQVIIFNMQHISVWITLCTLPLGFVGPSVMSLEKQWMGWRVGPEEIDHLYSSSSKRPFQFSQAVQG